MSSSQVPAGSYTSPPPSTAALLTAISIKHSEQEEVHYPKITAAVATQDERELHKVRTFPNIMFWCSLSRLHYIFLLVFFIR